VIGARHDALTDKKSVIPEVQKCLGVEGKHLHPEASGKPASQGVFFAKLA
jgi:hypothetical protein